MPPEMKPVQSALVREIGYDETTAELFVGWAKSDKTSVYSSVPPSVASDVISAPSVGKAILSSVKGKYDHRYVS